jgi:hypothetical protein
MSSMAGGAVEAAPMIQGKKKKKSKGIIRRW